MGILYKNKCKRTWNRLLGGVFGLQWRCGYQFACQALLWQWPKGTIKHAAVRDSVVWTCTFGFQRESKRFPCFASRPNGNPIIVDMMLRMQFGGTAAARPDFTR